MKKLFLLIAVLSSLSFAQFQIVGVNGQNIKVNPGTNVDVIYAVTTANSATDSTNYYTNWINLKDYVDLALAEDTTRTLFKLNYRSVADTVTCTITIEGRFTAGDTSKVFPLAALGNFIIGNNDSLYTFTLKSKSSYLSKTINGAAIVGALGGNSVIPDQIRIKFYESTPSYRNGYMKFWLQLPRPLQKTGFKLQ